MMIGIYLKLAEALSRDAHFPDRHVGIDDYRHVLPIRITAELIQKLNAGAAGKYKFTDYQVYRLDIDTDDSLLGIYLPVYDMAVSFKHAGYVGGHEFICF